MAKTEYEIYTTKMTKLATAIDRKAQKAFAKLPFTQNLTLSVSFQKGWRNSETQNEDSVVMSVLSSEPVVRSSISVSPIHGQYGLIQIPESFATDYNKTTNIHADLVRLLSNFKKELEAKIELEARRARVPLSKGTFRNPLMQW